MDWTSLDRALDLARRDSPDGFTKVYELLAGEIAAFCRARGVAEVDAVVNDIFLGAFRSLPNFEGAAKDFRSYLYRIARNKIYDAHAAVRRNDRLSEIGRSQLGLPEIALDTGHLAVQQLEHQRIRQALDSLSPDQRDVILLRFLADLSIAETAAALDKPRTAVKSLQRRALASLRRHFLEDGGIPETL